MASYFPNIKSVSFSVLISIHYPLTRTKRVAKIQKILCKRKTDVRWTLCPLGKRYNMESQLGLASSVVITIQPS